MTKHLLDGLCADDLQALVNFANELIAEGQARGEDRSLWTIELPADHGQALLMAIGDLLRLRTRSAFVDPTVH